LKSMTSKYHFSPIQALAVIGPVRVFNWRTSYTIILHQRDAPRAVEPMK